MDFMSVYVSQCVDECECECVLCFKMHWILWGKGGVEKTGCSESLSLPPAIGVFYVYNKGEKRNE